jgi:hypothetical protein
MHGLCRKEVGKRDKEPSGNPIDRGAPSATRRKNRRPPPAAHGRHTLGEAGADSANCYALYTRDSAGQYCSARRCERNPMNRGVDLGFDLSMWAALFWHNVAKVVDGRSFDLAPHRAVLFFHEGGTASWFYPFPFRETAPTP